MLTEATPTRFTTVPRGLLLVLLLLSAQAPSAAQPLPTDTVRLAVLREAAARQDPRALQADLLEQAARLRLDNLRAQRRPQLAFTAQATVQNETPSLPFDLPGVDAPQPPLEQTRAQAEVSWLLFDGGRLARQADVERRRLVEQQAGVAVAGYGLREATTEAFFGALLLQAQAQTLALAAEDLDARLDLVRKQAADGIALGADAAALEAEGIRVRQQAAEAEAGRRAALAVLAHLTGYALAPDQVLALPRLEADAARLVEIGSRPEFERFARMADRLEAEARLAEAARRPQLSLFGQAGVGRPSPFDLFSDTFGPYALAGVRASWAPLDWGQARRRAEALRLQARVAETEAAAFEEALNRAVEEDRHTIARLEAALPEDARAVALREEIVRVAQRQLEAGTLLPAQYADRLTDLAEARLTLERHRIERARAQARVLSTLGQYPVPGLAAGAYEN